MKTTMRQWLWLIGMAVLLVSPVRLVAQPVEAPSHTQPYTWNSKVHRGKSGNTTLAESHRIAVTGAPWLRLFFDNARLGEQSYIILKSVKDGAWQRLDATTIAQWYNTSAYFNGDAIELQIHVAPNDRDVSVKMKELMVGEWVGGAPPESQCGPTDNRVPSNHLASGRILSIGCTGWIVNCASNNLQITAGHCSGGSNQVLQFNVPASNANGTLNNPPPQDQYSINSTSWQFVNGGIGNDWGIFQVFPNSVTGLLPAQAQAASFTLKQSLTPPTIRVTGFGVDFNDPTRNQTQQTHAGPNAGSSGTTMRYQADTEGGNSGSPVIDDATGEAVGVHTHGGCTTGGSGNNSGTSTFNAAFWSAVSQCGGGGGGCTNIALNKTATASSTNGSNVAGRAVDGNNSTFWRSNAGGTQWLQVDLGTGTLSYSSWELSWVNSRHASSYQIRVSNSSSFSTFTTVFSTTSGNGGTDTGSMTGAPRTERYVRIHMTGPSNARYGLNEFKICSSSSSTNKTSGELSDVSAAAIPEQITLHANYPNPFNPSTNISFSLPEDAPVALKVYSLIGEEVATLVNERRTAGTHTVVFDAVNLPSGVYFSVLNVGEIRLVRRLVLMK